MDRLGLVVGIWCDSCLSPTFTLIVSVCRLSQWKLFVGKICFEGAMQFQLLPLLAVNYVCHPAVLITVMNELNKYH